MSCVDISLDPCMMAGPHRLRFGPFLADLETYELWKDDAKIRLSGQPFEILAILLRHPGQVVSREQLRSSLWPSDTFVDFDHGLNAAMNKLREALSDSPEAPVYIETLPRRGYRFIAQVTPLGVNPPAASEAIADPDPSPSRRPYYVAGALVVLTLLGLAFYLLRHPFSSATSASTGSQEMRVLTSTSDETSEPSFSPDGNFIAYRRSYGDSPLGDIVVHSVHSDRTLVITKGYDDNSPVWSPDGQAIAFTRANQNHISIHVVPIDTKSFTAAPEADREFAARDVAPNKQEIAWSPDGAHLAFSAASGIYLISVADGSTRRVTETPPPAEDWGPAFSPDGSRLLFVRSHDVGLSDEILSVPTAGGEPTQVVSERAHVLGPPQWSTDAKTVIYSSDRGSHAGLWRVSAVVRDVPVQFNDSGAYPAVSRQGDRLAYQRIVRSLNIWELDLASPSATARILIPATSETDQGPGPQISPDNRKIAFMSDRSGTMEIWVSNRDGSNPRQLTSLGSAGTPRFSPDSQSVVFDVELRNGSAIYIASLSGGPPRALVQETETVVCPSFSRDGQWIFYAANRKHQFQVWKVPVAGGTPEQVTHNGGHAPLASWDGKLLYYAKNQYANPEIWQVPLNGGVEKPVSPMVRPFTWASWSVTRRGIVFAAPTTSAGPGIRLFDASTGEISDLGKTGLPPFWLSAASDTSSVLFDQPGWRQAQIVLVENFR